MLSSLLANSLFWFSISIKCHVDLGLGDMQGTQLPAWLSVHELLTDAQWPISDSEGSDLFGPCHDAHLLCMQSSLD